MNIPRCCKCGRPVTNEQGYGWDGKRRLWWCEDCADPLPKSRGMRAVVLRILSWLAGLWGLVRT